MYKDGIAVIGIALKLPSANNLQEFEEVLLNKQCCIGKISEERKQMADTCRKILGHKDIGYVEGAFLVDVTAFEHPFFNLSPLEATLMDINQRLFLETAIDAIEDAGYGAERLKGTNTGVYYVGNGNMDYLEIIRKIHPEFESIGELGNLPAFAAGRLAFRYDLKGPAIFVNTLCSSSLVALNMACKAIGEGECDMAIVGGTRVEILPAKKEAIGIESKDARIRAFSDDANGTVGGEGSIVMLVKKLSIAKKEHDNIYAVIKGGAVNQDGHCSSLTAPNSIAQAEVIEKAWENAQINPLEIGYIEAHGTGTKLGDPIEIAGLTNAYSKYEHQNQFCYIGSVKTNYGHLDCISGLLGVIKVILSLKNKKIYPQLFFSTQNRYIDFANSPVRVCTDTINWSDVKSSRICGVSSFGFAGTNCHMIIQEYDENVREYVAGTETLHFLCLSAESYDKLLILVKNYQQLIKAHNDIDIWNLCYSANIRNSCYKERIIFGAKDIQQLYNKMKEFTSGNQIENYMNKEYYRQNFDSGTEKLISDYIDGKDVNFKEFYSGKSYDAISVPLYPFLRKKLWISNLMA